MPDVRGCHLPDDLLYEAKMNADGFPGCACPIGSNP
jgi:hypothetical protein